MEVKLLRAAVMSWCHLKMSPWKCPLVKTVPLDFIFNLVQAHFTSWITTKGNSCLHLFESATFSPSCYLWVRINVKFFRLTRQLWNHFLPCSLSLSLLMPCCMIACKTHDHIGEKFALLSQLHLVFLRLPWPRGIGAPLKCFFFFLPSYMLLTEG